MVKPNLFSRRSFLVKKPGCMVCVDTAFMDKYTKSNRGIKYLIVFIDMYSRYLTVYPSKSIANFEMKNILNDFFSNNIHKYEKINTDSGVEFLSKFAKEIYNKFEVHHYCTYSKEIKSSIAERVIRTLKSKIHKYITHTNSEKYIDVLDEIVSSYNRSSHSGLLQRTPLNVHLMFNCNEILNFTSEMFKYRVSKKRVPSRDYDAGEYVRLKSTHASQNIFRKGFHQRNTSEIFKIHSLNSSHIPTTYNIVDLDGEKILGVFYKQELVVVRPKSDFKIKILKKRKRKGKIEYFVNFIDHPNSSNQWIPSENLSK